MNPRLLELALRIADDAAKGMLLAESVPSDEPEWMDVSEVPAEAQKRLREVTEYLTLRGQLVTRPGRLLVRLVDGGLPN